MFIIKTGSQMDRFYFFLKHFSTDFLNFTFQTQFNPKYALENLLHIEIASI